MLDERPEGAATDAPTADGADEARTDAAAGADDGDANGKADDKVAIPRHEYNAIREAREREKALTEELARVKAEAEQRRNPPTAGGSEAEITQKSIDKRQKYIARLEAAAEAGNEDAEALLVVHRDALEAEQRTVYRLQMADVPEAEREKVRAFMREKGITMPAVARQLMRGESYETLEAELARTKAELAEAKKGKLAKAAVEDTRIVGSPGGSRSPAAKEGEAIPLAEYHKRMRDDPAQTIADRKAGKFTIKVG